MITAKAFEQKVYNEWKNSGFLVTRFDYKNKKPDFLAIDDDGVAHGVECKRYLSCKNKREALAMWRRKQPTQVKAFKELQRKGLAIHLEIMLKGGKRVWHIYYRNSR